MFIATKDEKEEKERQEGEEREEVTDLSEDGKLLVQSIAALEEEEDEYDGVEKSSEGESVTSLPSLIPVVSTFAAASGPTATPTNGPMTTPSNGPMTTSSNEPMTTLSDWSKTTPSINDTLTTTVHLSEPTRNQVCLCHNAN